MIDETSPHPGHAADHPPRLTRRVSHTLAILLGVVAGISLVLSVIP